MTAWLSITRLYFGILVGASNIVDNWPFQTYNTLNFTNSVSGTMMAQPGFNFNTESATGSHFASSFNNSGTIISVDAQTIAFASISSSLNLLVPSLPPGTGAVAIQTGVTGVPVLNPAAGPGINTPVSSETLVSATNIVISGTMSTGEMGLLQLNGANINLNSGSLGAGFISELDANATVSRGVVAAYMTGVGAVDAFFSPAAGVNDIYWSVDNASSETEDVVEVYDTLVNTYGGGSLVVDTGTFPLIKGSRNGTVEGLPVPNYLITPYTGVMPISSAVATATSPPVTPNFVPYVFLYPITPPRLHQYVQHHLCEPGFRRYQHHRRGANSSEGYHNTLL